MLKQTHRKYILAFALGAGAIALGWFFYEPKSHKGDAKISQIEDANAQGKNSSQRATATRVQAGYRPQPSITYTPGAPSAERLEEFESRLSAFESQIDAIAQRGVARKRKVLGELTNALAEQHQMEPSDVRVTTTAQGVLRNVTLKREIPISSPVQDAKRLLEANRDLFGLGEFETLELASLRPAQQGGLGSVVYSRRFKDILVNGNDIALTLTESGIKGILGQFEFIDPSFDVSATISVEDLVAAASDLEGHKNFVPLPDTAQPQIIFSGNRPVFVYSIHARDFLGRTIEVFVEPRAKEMFKVRVKHFTVQTSVTGKNLDGEDVQFYVEDQGLRSYLKSYPLQDLAQSTDRLVKYKEITNIEETEDGGYRWDAENLTASAPSGPWPRDAISAVQNVNRTFEYLYNVHGMQGTGSLDPEITVNTGADSATWRNNAGFGGNQMLIGVGGSRYSNLAGSSDVIAHELGHGVTQSTSRLVYENESGALNESFSDIIGVMVDREDWLLGEDVSLVANFMRSMKNPLAGDPPQPSHMDQFQDLPLSIDKGGVHVNSGIPNRMFYLLAEGLSTEGLGTSVGKAKSEKIAFQTYTTLTRTSDFDAAAAQMLLVAETLYSATTEEREAVIAAWGAVGVDLSASSEDDDGGTDDNPSVDRKQIYELPVGDDFLVDLRPRDGYIYDPDDDVFDVYAVKACVSTKCYGVENDNPRTRPSQDLTVVESTRVGPLNDVPVKTNIPSITTGEEGLTFVHYVGTDGNIYGSLVSEYDIEPLMLDFDDPVQRVSVSRDFSRLAFVLENSRDIYVYSFGQGELEVVTVSGVSFSQAGGGENVLRVDSLAFSADGDQLVFDYLVCRPSDSGDSDCEDIWSIGIYDLNKETFDYPYPDQRPDIDLGFPQLSSIGGERIVFQGWDYRGCPSSGSCSTIDGIIYQYDYFSGETTVIETTRLSLAGNFIKKFGWPAYFPGDIGVTWTSGWPEVSYQALDENFEADSSSVEYWESDNMSGLVHRAAYLGVYSQLDVSPASLQLGAVLRGKSKTRTLTVENVGNQDLEITGVSTSDGIEATLRNIRLPAGESEEFQVTFNSKGTRLGKYSGTVDISSTADRGDGNVAVVALVDRDTDGDGILDSRDRDDDNDGVPDNQDAFPLDESESVDTDQDGIGNNADTDDDGDGLSDENEIELGTNPLDSDSDGDTIYDGEELTLGLDPLDGECPIWYCLTNRGWLWERAKLLTDADGDGLNLGEELEQGTDPQVADSDGDGLSDGDEIALGTDPGETDTDSDGLNDKRETVLGTSPLLLDTDGDGLNDGAEVSSYSTDPKFADSDGDGATDGAEVTAGSNPLLVDTDGDGLSDGTEINDLGSDPTATDSDADGVADDVEVDIGSNLLASDSDDDGATDGEEIEEGTNPIDADDCPLHICGGSFLPRLLASITSIVSGTSGSDDLQVAYSQNITNVSANAGNDTIVLNDFTRRNAHNVVVDGGAGTDELQIPDYGTNAFYFSKDGCYNVLNNANLGAGSNNGTIRFKSIERLSINGQTLRILGAQKGAWNSTLKRLYGLNLTSRQQERGCDEGYGFAFTRSNRYPGMSSSDNLTVFGTDDDNLQDNVFLLVSRSDFQGKLFFNGGAGREVLSVLIKNDDAIRLGEGDDIFRPAYFTAEEFAQADYSKLDGGPGWDTLSFTDADGTPTTADKTLTWGGAVNFEHLEGTDASERIVGNNNDNILKGGNGSDVILGGGGRDVIYPNWDNGNRSNEDAGIRNTITLGADGDFIYAGYTYSPPNLASVDRVTDFDPDEDKVWGVTIGGTPGENWDWVQGSGANSDHTYFRAKSGGSKRVLLILENVDANELSSDNYTEDHLWDLPVASSANKCSQDCD